MISLAQHSISTRLKHLPGIIYRSITNINLYQTTSTDQMDVHKQRIYTRVYLLLFLSSLSVVLFYTALVERRITKTHFQPSIVDYEYLLGIYSDHMNCPCTHISIPYNEFVTELRVSSFHPACTTDTVERVLSEGLYPQFKDYYAHPRDFRSWMFTFINSLEQLCTLTQKSIANTIVEFRASTILANQIMSRIQFNNEMNITISRFQIRTPIAFARTLDLIRTMIQGNALMGMFSSNWELIVAEKGQGKNASFRSIPVNYYDPDLNQGCSCATSKTCATLAQLFDDNATVYYTFQGLMCGCYLLETVLLSSLSCFYSEACIDQMRQVLIPSYASIIDYQNIPDDRIKFNASLTRFDIDDTIETMAYEMFIESWLSNVSYERFFNSCAPSYCTYTYHYRFDALELLTTFLSVFAGLSLGLHFIVPHAVELMKKIRNRFRVTPA